MSEVTTGRWNIVRHQVWNEITDLITNEVEFKIGITGSLGRRWSVHQRKWDDGYIVYATTSERIARQAEAELVEAAREHFPARCKNGTGGGGGNLAWSYRYHVYVLIRPRRPSRVRLGIPRR